MFGIIKELDKAEDFLIESIKRSEKEIFSLIKSTHTNVLRKDISYLSKLPLLIYGYVYCEKL